MVINYYTGSLDSPQHNKQKKKTPSKDKENK